MELILFAVPIWLLFALAAGYVGTQKGDGGCGWFFIGFMFGPFGLLFALLNPPKNATLERKALKQNELKKCPWCAELVRLEAVKCRHCGEIIEAQRPE